MQSSSRESCKRFPTFRRCSVRSILLHAPGTELTSLVGIAGLEG
jgi:hypothetical protein